jgi:chromosome segregation protein
VFIKKIDIRGFKTFSKKVSISLGTGFTVITGPNGSGKSNILDALKFSLGELSPKELRGQSLSDLVHKSQAGGAPTAYVAVQFDNSDRKIPVESDLVSISREFSKGGEGIYRLNGRRLSRKQVQDILSSADIQVTGFNLIAQHAITRLAEIGTEERRRILEDLIGIGVFEAKKADAKEQLQVADLNLKVAAARVDEVRNRIEQLELERNNLLRYNLLRTEIGRYHGQILSGQIGSLEAKRASALKALEEEQGKLEGVRRERDNLNQQRSKVQDERRRFEEKTVTKGNQELFDLERKIAEAGSEMVKAKTEAETSRTLHATRVKQQASLQKETEEMEANIKQFTASVRNLSARSSGLDEEFATSTASVEKLTQNLHSSRESLAQDSKKLDAIQDEIDGLGKELARITASSKGSSTKLDLTAGHLQTLESRQQEFSQLAEELKKRIKEMERLEKDEEKRLETIEERAKQYVELKTTRQKDIEQAIEIAKRARVTVVEFNTQKNLAENLQAEERALQKIEDMADEGELKGVVGRLNELVKFNDEYSKAVEAASAGWMRALVVKDLPVAIKCAESLKRTKVGRVKIIPLEDVEMSEEDGQQRAMPGIIGLVSSVIRSDKAVLPAVNFVFGDTLLATNQKAAYLAASEGKRCVVTSGDLYEPGGGLESGYYRAPFDISTIVPRPTALDSLEKTVKSLETVVQRQRSEVDRIEDEMGRLRDDRVSASRTREALARDVESARKGLERTRGALQGTRRKIESLQSSIEREKLLLNEMTEKQSEMKRRLGALEDERTRLRVESRKSSVAALEQERDKMVVETESLLREKLDLESKLASHQSSLDTLRPGWEQVRIPLRSLETEIRKEEARVKEATDRMELLQAEMKGLETEKKRLLETLGMVGAEREKYEGQFAEIEKSLRTLLERMDPLNSGVTELKAGLREVEAQLTIWKGQLGSLRQELQLDVSADVIREAEELKRALQEELDGIGAVNQLAVEQYEDLKGNYKQLSVRISSLEQEKLAILDFMNELDRRKRETFMTAFKKVNDTFQELFREMTSDAGNGRMVLEYPDNPFEGGMDVLLQFPGKPELTMGSASGGEKSVATVCYLLALQQIHPMPFYVMDEIDAHLDVLNTKRLATLVRSRSKGSQFIVISLKDTTISRAERVYGVYQEKGMSQVISLPATGVVD